MHCMKLLVIYINNMPCKINNILCILLDTCKYFDEDREFGFKGQYINTKDSYFLTVYNMWWKPGVCCFYGNWILSSFTHLPICNVPSEKSHLKMSNVPRQGKAEYAVDINFNSNIIYFHLYKVPGIILKAEAQTSIRNSLCPHRAHSLTLDIKILAMNSDLLVNLQLQAHLLSSFRCLLKGPLLSGAFWDHPSLILNSSPNSKHSSFSYPGLQHLLTKLINNKLYCLSTLFVYDQFPRTGG